MHPCRLGMPFIRSARLERESEDVGGVAVQLLHSKSRNHCRRMFFFIQSELVSQTGIVLETNIDGLLSSVAIHFWENPQGLKMGFMASRRGSIKEQVILQFT